jgi:hypothetical protein
MPDDTLSELLGRRRAFSLIAGRCSAADAACLRRLRNERLFKPAYPSWDEFCEARLRMSRAHANRIIRYLDDFGPAFFTLAQLTRITPDEFRGIAHAVTPDAIEIRGETIPLAEENSSRIEAAVAELCAAIPPAPLRLPAPAADSFPALEARLAQLLDDLERAIQRPHDRTRMINLLRDASTRIAYLQFSSTPSDKYA